MVSQMTGEPQSISLSQTGQVNEGPYMRPQNFIACTVFAEERNPHLRRSRKSPGVT
jgi:hypothetical protein